MIFALTLVMTMGLAGQAPPTPPLLGYWTNEARSVVIMIAPCGDNRVCGTVQSASEKAQADAARGGTPKLIGAELLRSFAPVGPGRWKGRLFVPDLNQRSTAEIIQRDADRLQIRGCAVGRLLCESQTWFRTTEPEISGSTS